MIKKSFEVFKPNYLYENGEVKRWKMTQDRNIKIHKGEGFSDHLPIFAKFSEVPVLPQISIPSTRKDRAVPKL